MVDPETKIRWREVLDRFLILLLSMSFLVAAAVAAAIFVVDSPLDLEIRAWIYVKLDQPDLAVNTYIRLTQVDPHNHKALEALGDLYTVKAAHREAAGYYAKAAQLNRSVPNLLNAAISSQKTDLKEEALKYYQEILALDPDNVVAKTNVKSVAPPKAAKALIPSPKPLEPAEKAHETQGQQPEPLSAPPEAPGQEHGDQQSQVKKPKLSQKPVESPTPKSMPPCNHLLKDVKDLIGHTEPDKLSLFRERIGDPHRRCETETRKTYCFKCIVRGRLTDTIEIIERDDRIESYYFGSCGCDENGAN